MSHRHLPRLSDDAYYGFAAVHWTLTIERRRQGWLTDLFHYRFRERLLHALSRYYACCPIYCVMPDHFHLLCLGLSQQADQRLMIRQLRASTNDLLSRCCGNPVLQKQPYDHVLRADERAHYAFVALARYIAENPVRAGLTGSSDIYPYTGCMIPGYPILDVWADDYWAKFWRIVESRD